MGSEYTEIPPLDLNEAFADSKNSTPLVFVMSTGADPMSNLLRFAEERNMAKRFHAISLGQGQGPIATALIQDQSRAGDWVPAELTRTPTPALTLTLILTLRPS